MKTNNIWFTCSIFERQASSSIQFFGLLNQLVQEKSKENMICPPKVDTKTTLRGFFMLSNFAFGKLSPIASSRSEEHTSELQSRFDLVCRLLLEKKKISI